MSSSSIEGSRVGLWNRKYSKQRWRRMYGDPSTAKKAAAFLKQPDIKTIEDWGCGHGGFKRLIGFRQTYIGIDGSKTRYADKIADLETYRSTVDAIHMRHVLEHNPNWQAVLNNALASFTKRMVLTLFTPFVEKTHVIAEYPDFTGTGVVMVDVAFRREDIVSRFEGISWTSEENLKTRTQYDVEHIFYLSKQA